MSTASLLLLPILSLPRPVGITQQQAVPREVVQAAYEVILADLSSAPGLAGKEFVLDPRNFNRWRQDRPYGESYPMFGRGIEADILERLRSVERVQSISRPEARHGLSISNSPAEVDTSQAFIAFSTVELEDLATAEVEIYLRTRHHFYDRGRDLVSWQVFAYTLTRNAGSWSVAVRRLKVTS